MFGLQAGVRQARVKPRIILTGLLTEAFKIFLALTEILVNLVAICQIKSQRPEDLLQCQSREGFRNPLRGLTTQERVHHRIQGHARFSDQVPPEMFLNVLFCHGQVPLPLYEFMLTSRYEPSGPLPLLNKKIFYLDQNAVSNLAHARKADSQKEPPRRGFLADVEAISCLLPY